MDSSGNNNLQSSASGGDEEEYDSRPRPPPPPSPSSLQLEHHHQHHQQRASINFLNPFSSNQQNPNPLLFSHHQTSLFNPSQNLFHPFPNHHHHHHHHQQQQQHQSSPSPPLTPASPLRLLLLRSSLRVRLYDLPAPPRAPQASQSPPIIVIICLLPSIPYQQHLHHRHRSPLRCRDDDGEGKGLVSVTIRREGGRREGGSGAASVDVDCRLVWELVGGCEGRGWSCLGLVGRRFKGKGKGSVSRLTAGFQPRLVA
ncbi:unnamed protein product [Linum trigynum]|uniref:Uncharacterized protein n=1 Tax=Linum trigynum TaxID=586398 RepID=A0AAV2E8X1_9ROSI